MIERFVVLQLLPGCTKRSDKLVSPVSIQVLLKLDMSKVTMFKH